ncbi:MAG: CNNM domain-containing protein [Pirellulaceae bacterium]
MEIVYQLSPFLLAMIGLLACSGFFSASEAALFSLRANDRRQMERGTTGERFAAKLLADPDRLLSTILFCNLVINMAFFALSSMCAIRLDGASQFVVVAFAIGSLLTIIFVGEMLPKTIGVLVPRRIAALSGPPLSLVVRVLGRVHPIVDNLNRVAQRVLWPSFQPEPYLDTNDIERAIAISGDDESVIRQEQAVIHNIVQLSSIRVDEWMRPRTQFEQFDSPVHLEDLNGVVPSGGYLLVTEPDSDEIELALRLDNFFSLPKKHLERLAEHVLYLPWCATVADAMEGMSSRDREVTVVVNEYGETIGVLTIEDILETIFTYAPSRSRRLLDRNPLHPISEGRWVVSGMMSLRQLARKLDVAIPRTHSVTVAGVIQEETQRLAQADDECVWGPFHFRVIEVGERGNVVVELTLVPYREGDS